MKVVVAVDSFKGSLSSIEAGQAIKEGIVKVNEKAEVIVRPIADGGEGTTEALVEGLGGKWVTLPVKGPLMTTVHATYGIVEESQTAILEMAAAAGITLVKPEERNPLEATTYGVGEMVADALKRGCRNFIIGIGGSATNDCGIGMLMALGYEFLDKYHQSVALGARGLKDICFIEDKHVFPELRECHFRVACDVNNHLYGKEGATYIYGPQKGVTEEMKEELDQVIERFAKCSSHYTENDYSQAKGAGAAGGMGYAFLSYLKAELLPGISLVLETIQLEETLKGADYVVTGEGQLDRQTTMGKVPSGVARLAKKQGLPVIAFAGALSKEAYLCNEVGIKAFFAILPRVMTLEEAMEKEMAKTNLKNTVEQVFRLLYL